MEKNNTGVFPILNAIRIFGRVVYYDILFLLRQGFFVAYAVVILAYIGVLSILPPSLLRSGFVIFAVYSDTSIIGFFFAGAMVFLEKDQNLLINWNVLPVSWLHYIASKVCTFSLLSLVISLCLYIPFMGFTNVGFFCAGVVLSVMFYIPLGLLLAGRVKKLLNYLLLSALVLFPALFPVFDFYTFISVPATRFLPGYGILIFLGSAVKEFVQGGIAVHLISPVLCAVLVIFATFRSLRKNYGGAV